MFTLGGFGLNFLAAESMFMQVSPIIARRPLLLSGVVGGELNGTARERLISGTFNRHY